MGLFSIFNRKQKPQLPTSPKAVFRYSGGSHVNPDTAMAVSAFYSGVIYISTQIAKLPWSVKDKDNKKVSNSVVGNLIDLMPNSEMNAFTFRLLLTQQALLFGNGYAEIERDMSGRPTALWPINARDVQATRTSSGELIYEIVDGGINGGNAYLYPQDIFHIRNFFSKDGIIAEGVVSYGSETLGIALGADKFANSLFANGGMPSGVLKAPGALSETAMAHIKESWSAAHGGRKVGGTALLEEGVTYEAISYDPNVLQFLDSRKFSVLEIARFLRIPPTKLYDQQTSSYNNIEHANLEVAVDTLDAWARNYEMEADVKLLNKRRNGRRTELEIYEIFRGDMDTRSQYFSRMMQNAAMSPNEIRVKEGLAPYDGGEKFYIASNNYTPVDKQEEILNSQIAKNLTPSKPTEKDTENPVQPDESERELNIAAIEYIRSKSNVN